MGKGTTFDLYFPRTQQPISKVEPIPAAPPPDEGKETILLVDDEPMLLTLGKAIIGRQGYQVLTARDGREAVDIYKKSSDKIDLVLLDLTMPNLSGRDAFRLMREINPGVGVLFASGYSSESVTDHEHRDALGFVSKPYSPAVLLHAVQTALTKKKNRTAAAPA